jgi:hypothetical protein
MTLDTNTMNWQGKWDTPSTSLVLQVRHQTLPDKNYKFSFRVYNPPEGQSMTQLTLSGVIIALHPSVQALCARVSCMTRQLLCFVHVVIAGHSSSLMTILFNLPPPHMLLLI